ncbi:hypothetical protein [Nocardia africana]|uniref:Uncharacterized protein n=1 Tax=Nocardia africana TaxID=134964 RepID=A0ABW6NTP9_9NOCA
MVSRLGEKEIDEARKEGDIHTAMTGIRHHEFTPTSMRIHHRIHAREILGEAPQTRTLGKRMK